MLCFAGNMVKANMIAFWNGTSGDIPSGWSCVSCTSAQPFFEKYLRISSSYGTTGGATTHTNPLTLLTGVPSHSATVQAGFPEGTNSAGSTHLHTVLNLTSRVTLANTSLPLSRTLLFIVFDAGIPTTIPAGVIVFYNSTTAPTNFTLYTAENNYFIQGNATANNVNGSSTHGHSNQTLGTNPTFGTTACTTGLKVATATDTHVHYISGVCFGMGCDGNSSTYLGNHTPLYVNLPMISATTTTPLPIGAIGVFNSSATANWGAWTSLYGYYIVGNTSAFNTTNGSLNHNHGWWYNVTSNSDTQLNCLFPVDAITIAIPHFHNANITAGNTLNQIPHRNVTLYTMDTQPAGDTCTYSGSGDWAVSCSDNCIIIANTLLPSNSLILGGVGKFTILANITINKLIKDVRCRMINLINDGKRLIIKNG